MKRSRKHTNAVGNEEPKVIAATIISKAQPISRRDFLKLTTTTLASVATASLLSSCSPSAPIPTATPAPPSGTINNNDTLLLGFPGEVANVIALLAAGTHVELRRLDSTKDWIEVRVKEGEHAGQIGWTQRVDVSFASGVILSQIPISHDISAIPTVEITVEGKVTSSQEIYTFPGESQASGSLSEGDTVTIVERDSTDTWFKIQTSSGQTGWIPQYAVEASSDYTSIRRNYAVVPVEAPASGSNSSNNSSGGSYTYTVSYYYPN